MWSYDCLLSVFRCEVDTCPFANLSINPHPAKTERLQGCAG